MKFCNIISISLIYFRCFHYIVLPYVWWMIWGWIAWSGLLVPVVGCVGKFSLPGGGSYYHHFVLFFTIVAGFGTCREYKESSSGLIDGL